MGTEVRHRRSGIPGGGVGARLSREPQNGDAGPSVSAWRCSSRIKKARLFLFCAAANAGDRRLINARLAEIARLQVQAERGDARLSPATLRALERSLESLY